MSQRHTTAPLLKGTAFITGAASGIGQATAISFAHNGIQNLSLSDMNLESLTTTCNSIKENYPHVEILSQQLDVCLEKAVDEAVEQTVLRFGRLGIAVNVAGIAGTNVRTSDAEENAWAKVLDTNLNGVWRSQRAELKAMLTQENAGPREGRGNIINVASMYGLTGTPSHVLASPYTASKHAVIGLTKSDAAQYASDGIRINAICPGYVNTPLLLSATASGAMDPEIAKTPMGRLAMVEEIADSIVFLASQMSSFMTGSAMVVDGGYLTN